VRVQTWDGSKWVPGNDWYQADDKLLRGMVLNASRKYAEETKITPRTPEQCKM
jgi:branched-chain amino acid transport system substrate-binding protein